MSLLSSLFKTRPTVVPEHIQTSAQFRERVLHSDRPVLLNVWSPTCAPCKRLAPVLVEVATAYADRIRVVEVSTMSDADLLRELGVLSTPTILVFDEGEEIGRMTGFRPRGWFDEMIAAEFPSA